MSDAVYKPNRVIVRHNQDGTTTCANRTMLPFTVSLLDGSTVLVPAMMLFEGTADHQVFTAMEGTG